MASQASALMNRVHVGPSTRLQSGRRARLMSNRKTGEVWIKVTAAPKAAPKAAPDIPVRPIATPAQDGCIVEGKAKAQANAKAALRVEPKWATLEEAFKAAHECTKCVATKKGTKGCRGCMGEWFEQIRQRGKRAASSTVHKLRRQVEVEQAPSPEKKARREA